MKQASDWDAADWTTVWEGSSLPTEEQRYRQRLVEQNQRYEKQVRRDKAIADAALAVWAFGTAVTVVMAVVEIIKGESK